MQSFSISNMVEIMTTLCQRSGDSKCLPNLGGEATASGQKVDTRALPSPGPTGWAHLSGTAGRVSHTCCGPRARVTTWASKPHRQAELWWEGPAALLDSQWGRTKPPQHRRHSQLYPGLLQLPHSPPQESLGSHPGMMDRGSGGSPELPPKGPGVPPFLPCRGPDCHQVDACGF